MANNTDFDDVAPHAASMIESMRAYGYTVSAAVADLIDNSITADTSNVWLTFQWNGSKSWASITDDGKGMTEGELRDAMRLGSMSPLKPRLTRDLGRFGLGMKTASFSQCRRLTVLSRTSASKAAIRRWDLDYLTKHNSSEWKLLKEPHAESLDHLVLPEGANHGTVVLWELMDRIVGESDANEDEMKSHFNNMLTELERNLSMLFHRFLQGSRPELRLFINGRRIKAWDPFLTWHPSTDPFPPERINLGKQGQIRVKGYVLPHKDKLSADEHADAGGPAGWNTQQGFYIYRNDRLIVAGSWLGLGPGRGWTKEEHYKLARISLDLPNTMDQLWHLDVKKSVAVPPPSIRGRLRKLADAVRNRAREVYAHRGKYGPRGALRHHDRPWRPSGAHKYRIDRKHPLIQAMHDEVKSHDAESFEAVLSILEETVPIEQIWIDVADNPDAVRQPFDGSAASRLKDVIHIAFKAIQRNRHLSDEDTIKLLLAQEEFSGEEAQAILGSMREVQ